MFSKSLNKYDTQKAYRKPKISLSYRQSYGLTGVGCYLCQYIFPELTATKVIEKEVKICRKIHLGKFVLCQYLSNCLPPYCPTLVTQ